MYPKNLLTKMIIVDIIPYDQSHKIIMPFIKIKKVTDHTTHIKVCYLII